MAPAAAARRVRSPSLWRRPFPCPSPPARVSRPAPAPDEENAKAPHVLVSASSRADRGGRRSTLGRARHAAVSGDRIALGRAAGSLLRVASRCPQAVPFPPPPSPVPPPTPPPP